MFTEKQNEILNLNTGYVEVLAGELWEANQKADYDPMHPQWDSLEDPIKDDYRTSASIAVLANNGESVSFDDYKYKDCINKLLSLLKNGYDPHSFYHEDCINDAENLVK
ncbi:hypothetical protein VPHK359_0034 [Vibrio phage K359]